MFENEFSEIVGCFCLLVLPYKGHHEATVVEDNGFEVVVELTNDKQVTLCSDEIIVDD